jgi:hypothetical protein
MPTEPRPTARQLQRRYRPDGTVNPIGWLFVSAALIVIALRVIAHGGAPDIVNPRQREVVTLAAPIVEVVQNYKRDHGVFPLDLTTLIAACEEAGIAHGQLPTDPWGRPLHYVATAPDGDAPRIDCYGSDGAKGGVGVDMDVIIWAGDS